MRFLQFVLILVAIRVCQSLSTVQEQFSESVNVVEPKWLYFPNGDGVPQLVYLNSSARQGARINYETDISFHLFTRQNPKKGDELYVDDILGLQATHFNASNPTKLIVHGWQSHGRSRSMLAIKDAYLESRECNVITVDWYELSSSIFYLGPVANTEAVGNYIGQLVRLLVDGGGSTLDQMHVVGHSLGAHVAGYAGASLAPDKIARITGLDPANPGFPFTASGTRHLDPSDAHYVDVIHTCAGTLGFSYPIGHADFYPNGGVMQPGCCCVPLLQAACSHARAYEFFTESITSKIGFRAVRCDTWAQFRDGTCRQAAQRDSVFMGDMADADTTRSIGDGVYFLHTNGVSPYARA